MAYVKSVTSKPVVTVGRFTSPDTMVSQVRRGITDFIGAARPSIADPFLPNKIEQGNIDDIRECIGCNICYTGDGLGVPLHCTQNPTFSEGWRRGWHPEKIAKSKSDSTVLVVGGGPAGLEATRALGQRGYQVLLAESSKELGGRVIFESKLPGLSEWIRVRDYRVRQIQQMPNVQTFIDSPMTAMDAINTEAEFIVVATGATWLANGAYTDKKRTIDCSQLLTVTGRVPNDRLYHELQSAHAQGETKSIISRIGDCDAPSIIATAVFAGHRYARELEENIDADNPMRYDRVFFESS